jgi:hypothetical protein
MNDYTRFENLLFSFCKKKSIGMIQPDENLQYIIYIDNYEVRCFTSLGDIFLQIDLGEFPRAMVNQQDFIKNLMQQSLLDIGDFMSVVSLSEQNRFVLTSRVTLHDCGLSALEMFLGELVNQSDVYKGLLAEQIPNEGRNGFGMISVC